jgi:hypothetical protein
MYVISVCVKLGLSLLAPGKVQPCPKPAMSQKNGFHLKRPNLQNKIKEFIVAQHLKGNGSQVTRAVKFYKVFVDYLEATLFTWSFYFTLFNKMEDCTYVSNIINIIFCIRIF